MTTTLTGLTAIHADRRSCPRRGAWALLLGVVALVGLLLGPSPVSAMPVITVQNSTVTSPGSSFFDVFISIPAGDPSIHLGGFNVDVRVPSLSGITFTSVNYPPLGTTAGSYVYGGGSPPTSESFNRNNGLPVYTPGFGGTSNAGAAHEARASDTSATPQSGGTFYKILHPGDVFALMRVAYSADPGLPSGTVPVTLQLQNGLTDLSDENGASISFSAVNGQITVIGTTVPAPAGVVLFGIGSACLAGYGLRKRKQKPAA
jgi:hypothetical protein